MSAVDLAALRALAERATPGPWEAEPACGGFGALLAPDGALIFALAHGTSEERFTLKEQVPHDYAYLKAAHPAAVFFLIEAAERVPALEAENARLRALAEHYADLFCELGDAHECCGKLDDEQCSGCKARAALEPRS